MRKLVSRYYNDIWMLDEEDPLFEYIIVTALSLVILFSALIFLFFLVVLLINAPFAGAAFLALAGAVAAVSMFAKYGAR